MPVNHDDLLELVTAKLDRPGESTRWSEHPGAVLFSDLASIRPGPFYLMGINPGGGGSSKICENLYASKGSNHYADQCWHNTQQCGKLPLACKHLDPATLRLLPEFRTKIQPRVCGLIDALGVEPSALPSANAIFKASKKFRDLPQGWEWWLRCRDVHEQLWRLVKPKWIITLGFGINSPFTWLKPHPSYCPIEISVDGRWYRIERDLGNGSQTINVLGVLHPSPQAFNSKGRGRFTQYSDELLQFINEHIRPGSSAPI